MVERDWDFMSHGVYNTRYLWGATEEEERDFYQDTIDTIRRHTGKQLKGMLGPALTNTERTPDLMAEAGLIYHTDWFHDDQPFPMKVKQGRLITVPYSIETNDGAANMLGFEADYLAQIIKDQFDVLYKEGAESGRVMVHRPYIPTGAARPTASATWTTPSATSSPTTASGRPPPTRSPTTTWSTTTTRSSSTRGGRP